MTDFENMKIIDDEVFRPVVYKGIEYVNYYVTNYGRVYSLLHNKFLKGKLDRDGYFKVKLSNNKKAVDIPIHRIVANAFLINDDSRNMNVTYKLSCTLKIEYPLPNVILRQDLLKSERKRRVASAMG